MQHTVRIMASFRVPFGNVRETVEKATVFMAYVQEQGPGIVMTLWHERFGDFGTLYLMVDHASLSSYEKLAVKLGPDPEFQTLENEMFTYMVDGSLKEKMVRLMA